MLAKAGIQEFYIWIPASAGMTGREMGIDFEVDLQSTFFWNPSPSRRVRFQFLINVIRDFWTFSEISLFGNEI